MRYLILDIETLPIANVAEFVRKEDMKAPPNYTKPESIAKYIEEEYPAKLAAAALDMDLARVCAIGAMWHGEEVQATALPTEVYERTALMNLAASVAPSQRDPVCIVTFNGHGFDLPLLMRRARYLDVEFPRINLDRYKSHHIDLYEELKLKRNDIKAHGLRWYMRRLGWTDLLEADPLKDGGADVGQAAADGRWSDIAAHVRVDILGTYRLGQWMGVIPKDAVL